MRDVLSLPFRKKTLRGYVFRVVCSADSGWSVPCVSIQLTLSQESGSLKILTGVLVHRVTRPQRQSVFRVVVSGWSVPCMSIQLTLSQESGLFMLGRGPLSSRVL